MKIEKLLEKLDQTLPLSHSWINDKVGLHVRSDSESISNVLVAYELNDEIIQECLDTNSNFLILFHPFIYNPIAKIANGDRISRLLKKVIKHDISVYCVHTAFDTLPNGSNYLLAYKLGLKVQRPLVEHHINKNIGIGAICTPIKPMSSLDLLLNAQQAFGIPIRNNGLQIDKIKKVAVVAGSGMSFWADVLKNQVDAFVTADISYHDFHRADSNVLLIDGGHYETEKWIAEGMYNLFQSNIKKGVNFILSNVVTNPVEYKN